MLALGLGYPGGENFVDLGVQLVNLGRRRRVVNDVALALPHYAKLRRNMEANCAAVADDQLGRATADVNDDDLRTIVGIAAAGRAEERELCLLLAGNRSRVKLVALRDLPRELATVGGVTGGAGKDGAPLIGATKLFDHRRVVIERREDASHRFFGKDAAGVNADAKPRHFAAPRQLGDRAVGGYVGQQQPRRVRSDVNDGDSHRNEITLMAAQAPASASARQPAQRADCRPRSCPLRREWLPSLSRCAARSDSLERRRLGRRQVAVRGR